MSPTNNNLSADKRGNERTPELTRDQPVFFPATDIHEKTDSILVVCDMPGVDEKRVDVSLDNHELTITGYQDASHPEGFQLLYREYSTGVFRRTFTVTDEIDRSKIHARMSKGVLSVVLPKAEKVQPRRIQVETAS